jgi:EAL domain-containing protein (putative c-di-GMP-specific phosphodiesterase class I)
MATYAHQTGAFVIAEGIEDQDTLQYLHHLSDHRGDQDNMIQGGQGFELGGPSLEICGSYERAPATPITVT